MEIMRGLYEEKVTDRDTLPYHNDKTIQVRPHQK